MSYVVVTSQNDGNLTSVANKSEIRQPLLSHFLVVDPHPLFTDALSSLLWQCGALSVRAVVEHTEIIRIARRRPGTFILFNASTPGSKGVFGLEKVIEKVNAKSVIVILEQEDIALENFCRERGVGGIVSKLHSPKQIKEVVKAVMAGKTDAAQVNKPLVDEENDRVQLYYKISKLSPKETQVFAHLKEGRLNKQIAYDLDLSEATVKYHVGNILRKLSCHSRTQAAVIANRHAIFS